MPLQCIWSDCSIVSEATLKNNWLLLVSTWTPQNTTKNGCCVILPCIVIFYEPYVLAMWIAKQIWNHSSIPSVKKITSNVVSYFQISLSEIIDDGKAINKGFWNANNRIWLFICLFTWNDIQIWTEKTCCFSVNNMLLQCIFLYTLLPDNWFIPSAVS